MALDLENKNQGYLCGRLFAVLEKIQEDAQPGINSTIKDRFYGAASVTPINCIQPITFSIQSSSGKIGVWEKFWHEKQIQKSWTASVVMVCQRIYHWMINRVLPLDTTNSVKTCILPKRIQKLNKFIN